MKCFCRDCSSLLLTLLLWLLSFVVYGVGIELIWSADDPVEICFDRVAVMIGIGIWIGIRIGIGFRSVLVGFHLRYQC